MVTTILVPLLIYPYICRVLRPAGIGAVNFAQSVVYYFTVVAQLGVPTYGIRECAKVRDNPIALSRLVQEILILNSITCLVSYALFFICLFTVPQMRNEKTLFIVMSVATLLNVIGVEWLFSALEMYDYLAILSIISKIIMVLGVFLLVKTETDYVIYGALYVIGRVGWGVVNFCMLSKYVSLRPVGDYNFKKHIRPIMVFFGMTVATTIYTQMDAVMLGFMKGTTENGFYDAAVNCKLVLVSLITSLGTVLLPRASAQLEKGDEKSFRYSSREALSFVIAMAVPLCVYFILFAGPVIMLLSGKEFGNSVLPMRLIMPSLLFIGMTNITGLQVMVPLGKEKGVLYAEIAGATVNLIVNALLIPKFGASGAAIGTVGAEVFVTAVEFWCIRDMLPELFRKINFVKILFAAAAGTAASFWLLNKDWNIFAQLIVSAVLFFGVYCAIVAPEYVGKLGKAT